FVMRYTMTPIYRSIYSTEEYEHMTAAQLWKAIRVNARESTNPITERHQLLNTYLKDFPDELDYINAIRKGIEKLEFGKSTEETQWKMPEDEVCFMLLWGLPNVDQWNDLRIRVSIKRKKYFEDPEILVESIRRYYPLTELYKQREREKNEE